MKGILRSLLVMACVTGAAGATADERFSFEAYPASTVSQKTLTKIDWKSNPSIADDWKSKEAVEQVKGARPDFAGHFVVTRFGCGTACTVTLFVDVENGKIHKAPMQLPSDGSDLPKVAGGTAYRASSNMIFMSDLGYAGSVQTQSDGVVVYDEKTRKFQIVAKSKPYKMEF